MVMLQIVGQVDIFQEIPSVSYTQTTYSPSFSSSRSSLPSSNNGDTLLICGFCLAALQCMLTNLIYFPLKRAQEACNWVMILGTVFAYFTLFLTCLFPIVGER